MSKREKRETNREINRNRKRMNKKKNEKEGKTRVEREKVIKKKAEIDRKRYKER